MVHQSQFGTPEVCGFVLLAVLGWTAGCESVGSRVASQESTIQAYRPHEASRITLNQLRLAEQRSAPKSSLVNTASPERANEISQPIVSKPPRPQPRREIQQVQYSPVPQFTEPEPEAEFQPPIQTTQSRRPGLTLREESTPVLLIPAETSPSTLSEQSGQQTSSSTLVISEVIETEPEPEESEAVEPEPHTPAPPVLPVAPLAVAASDLGPAQSPFLLDLPTALRLAGANNLQIAFAAEQIQQAQARVDSADALWVPSVRAGVVYNNHTGQIQATEGDVVTASRSSLFAGAGAGVGNSPLNAGSGGPARMFVDLSLVDAYFEPLAARQSVQATEASHSATFNDTLLETATAYLRLMRANALIIISEEAVQNAEQFVKITEDFARTGEGLQADANRAVVELSVRRRNLLAARETAAVASAELARLLRLPQDTPLLPADTTPIPVALIDCETDLLGLIAQAQAVRPEIASASATIQESAYRTRQEQIRPWVPNLYAGYSNGGFGGGPGSDLDNFDDRGDLDVAAIWEVRNLGLGNRARVRSQESQLRQSHIRLDQWRDRIAAEVTQAHARTRFRHEQIATTEDQVRSAVNTLELNLEGIRNRVLRPIEIQQAIGAVATARQQYLDAVLDFNLAQFELLRAIGRPLELAPTSH